MTQLFLKPCHHPFSPCPAYQITHIVFRMPNGRTEKGGDWSLPDDLWKSQVNEPQLEILVPQVCRRHTQVHGEIVWRSLLLPTQGSWHLRYMTIWAHRNTFSDERTIPLRPLTPTLGSPWELLEQCSSSDSPGQIPIWSQWTMAKGEIEHIWIEGRNSKGWRRRASNVSFQYSLASLLKLWSWN